MLALPPRIVLVGFMGVGKTTVGRLLAKRLGYRFRDLDDDIVARVGLSVPEIFARHGEERFREEELRAAEDAMAKTAIVIATGGGAFVQPKTREVLRGGFTVWLHCTLDTSLSRVPKDGSRPNLMGTRETILELSTGREPAYGLADLHVDTTEATPEAVVRRVAQALTASANGEARRTRGE